MNCSIQSYLSDSKELLLSIRNQISCVCYVMRYDAILENHHHLYCAESDRIADYYNEEINNLLSEYFSKHEIQDFTIGDIKTSNHWQIFR